MPDPKIPGGFILLSRKLIESEIWDKPPLYIKVWVYLLAKAQHKPYKNLKRGQAFVTIQELIEVCSYKVGFRIEKPSKKQIYGILQWLRNPDERVNEGYDEGDMIVTTKVTHGMLVEVCNYAFYQDPKNYEGYNESATNDTTKEQRRSRQGNNNNKNDKNDKKKDSRKQVYDDSSIYIILANYFLEQIRKNNSEHKEPNIQSWANDIRLMFEIDNRTEEQIKYLMKWVQEDDFERANVLSTSKLRRRFDQLAMKVKSQKPKPKAKIKNIDWEGL
ncbi:DNA replication protein DnaD [Radiobacillus sp. PE A8.2]|uniref:DNA replication protein DnaD n=1 Tax=Radiobacillus sp. PE A8.2 TaxID=3380349 RepID=UPI00388E3264